MKKTGFTLSLIAMLFFQVEAAYGLPVNGVVTSGSAQISTPTENTLQVNQTSQKAIINWQTFNIGRGQTARFVQPNSSSISLNRINPNFGASQIFGNLVANGQVWLINPSGILFGKSARVNVGGLLATTSDIKDEDFLSGNYKFTPNNNFTKGSIINKGILQAAPGGSIALIGNGVENRGIVQAKLGKVIMGGAQTYTIDFDGDQLINFAIQKGPSGHAVDERGRKLSHDVKNSGIIDVSRGSVALTRSAAKKLMVDAINMAGVQEASKVSTKGGVIILDAGDGSVKVSNKVYAQARMTKV